VHFLEIRRSSRRRVSESVDIVLHNIRTLGENAGSAALSSFMLSLLPSSALNTWTEALCIALSKLSHLLINDCRISCWYRIKTVSSADNVLRLITYQQSAEGKVGIDSTARFWFFFSFFFFLFIVSGSLQGLYSFYPSLTQKPTNPVFKKIKN
jgi:hypothetical protein